MIDAQNKVAMISGANRGIGLAIAVPCYLFYIHFVGRSRRLLYRIERAGIEIVNIICDAREGITTHLVNESKAKGSNTKKKAVSKVEKAKQ